MHRALCKSHYCLRGHDGSFRGADFRGQMTYVCLRLCVNYVGHSVTRLRAETRLIVAVIGLM